MQRKTAIYLLFIFAALVIAIGVWKWTFKDSDVSVASRTAEVEIEAGVLTHEFENNEEAANTRYLGKVIVVSGLISAITDDGLNLSVYLKKDGDVSGVMCTFNKASVDTNRLKVGNQVRIKGFCDGYLLDVKLNKCSLEI